MVYPAVGDSVVITADKCNGQKAVVKQVYRARYVCLIGFSDGSIGELYFNQFYVVG